MQISNPVSTQQPLSVFICRPSVRHNYCWAFELGISLIENNVVIKHLYKWGGN